MGHASTRECRTRCSSVDETRTPVARRAGIGSDNPAEPGRDAAPPLEPVARKILDQIGEQRRAAVTVEEHDLGERKASVQDDLVNIASPCGLGRIAKLGIERKIPAFAP